MKRRLRKKKRIGEFKELGFQVTAELRPDITREEIYTLMDRLIDVLEARKLSFGGGAGIDANLEGFITHRGRGSATPEDCQAVVTLLANESTIVRYEVGELRDAWYG